MIRFVFWTLLLRAVVFFGRRPLLWDVVCAAAFISIGLLPLLIAMWIYA